MDDFFQRGDLFQCFIIYKQMFEGLLTGMNVQDFDRVTNSMFSELLARRRRIFGV